MRLDRYGAATLRFGAGDKALIIEVTRQAQQRPVSLIASWFPLPVPITASEAESFARLIVYRGSIPDETIGTFVPTQNAAWTQALNASDLEVFLDVAVGNGTPFKEEFSAWPDDLVRAKGGQALGAALLQPFDLGPGATINGQVMLTFVGTEVLDADEADVRKLRVK